ncbi:unnamed protein product [Clonostachys byssicola]|uniref:FAD-binding PCMH-type domain-containing protein n=1 Tax=Clonostachys byssicola TaxID=160290 RepID=A0A9N9XW71_9HYPO|nr:unnamed protein product [Clonostachys byssicola]
MILPPSLVNSLPQPSTQSVFHSLKFEHALYDNPYIPNITMTSVKEFLLAVLATAPSLVAALPKGLGTKATGTLDSCLTSALSGDGTRAHYPSSATFITEHAKYFNLNLQYLPYAIVYPKTTEEISAVVVCAGSNDKKVQGRSGNLDFANRGLGGANGTIIVDFENFQNFAVDTATGLATVGPGNNLAQLFKGLHDNGNRFLPQASGGQIGVSGLSLVGGLGYGSRSHGAMIDHLAEVEIVLADGTVTRASEKANSDLFWAVRGAGAGFGLVTELKFNTLPEPSELVTFTYTITSNDSAVLVEALKGYHDILRDTTLPREIGGVTRFSETTFLWSGAFFGNQSAFEALGLQSRLPSTLSATIKTGVSWSTLMSGLTGTASPAASPQHFYIINAMVTPTTISSNSAIDEFASHVFSGDSNLGSWSFQFDLYGGAVNDVAADATAFPHRDLLYSLDGYVSTTETTSTEAIEFINKGFEILLGHKSDSFLAYNGIASTGHKNPQQKYFGSNLARLQTLKSKFDPKDLFSTPQTVKLA